MHLECILDLFDCMSALTISLLQTVYPTLDLHRVNDAFRHSLELVKTTILKLNIPELDKELFRGDWLIPAQIIKPEQCLNTLVDATWATAYGRYHVFHTKQRKLGTATRVPHRVSTLFLIVTAC